jgi:hypothetical protein
MTALKKFLMLVGITLNLILQIKVILPHIIAPADFLADFQSLFQQMLQITFVITME